MSGRRRAPREPRLRRRRLLILASLLPGLLLVLVAARLLTLPLFMGQAQDAHERGDGAGMTAPGERLDVLNPVERWRAPFVEGTGRSMSGDLDGGRATLEEALRRTSDAPDDCTVRTNLVLTISAQADAAAEAGDSAAEQERATEALALIDEGPEGCLDGSDDGNGGEAGRQQQEEQRKLQEQTGQQEPSEEPSEDKPEEEKPEEEKPQEQESPEPTPSSETTTEPSPDPQQQELQERNADGAQEAEQDRQDRRDTGSGPDPADKPW